MAISRLKRAPSPPQPPHSNRSRENTIALACTACRKRKIKCSGEVPRCLNCRLKSSNCIYERSRRDRLKEATQLNFTLAALLRDLSEHVNNDDKQRIEDALEHAADDLLSHATSASLDLGKRNREPSTSEDEDGEAHVTASVGSNEGLDHLDEDLMRDHGSRATGYVGLNSEVQWLRSAQRQTEDTGPELFDQPYGPPGSTRDAASERSNALHDRWNNAKEHSEEGSMKHMNDTTFFLDGDNIETDFFVDPYEDPDPDVAERLFNCYLETVHPYFPLVHHTFADQVRKYLSALKHNNAYQVSRNWRTQMNLLLAIGAKYSHIVKAGWRGNDGDHVVYMTRAARLLDLNGTVMTISAPDLALIQATSALAFYLLVIGHVSRAWIMIGISIRLALSLGLHLRNEDPRAEESKKESLVRTWWGLQSIESLVSAITGRPPVIALEDCTVSLPHDVPGKQLNPKDKLRKFARRGTGGNSPHNTTDSYMSEVDQRDLGQGHYLIHHTNIGIISQKVLLELYSPRTAARSWKSVQGSIARLLNELEEWSKAALLGSYQAAQNEHVKGPERGQFLLKTDYWSTKMLITRPCLCRIERRIQKESKTSVEFDKKSAEACVGAALEMTKLFPDGSDLNSIYSKGPWWAIVHLIMQSIAVLILDITYSKRDMENSEPSMVISVKKLIRCLRAMRHKDPVAARAYHVVFEILKKCAPALQSQADELLALYEEETSEPDSYQEHRVPHSAQQTMEVLNEESCMDTIHSSSAFDSRPSQYYPRDDSLRYQDKFDPFGLLSEPTVPMPFGNPFFMDFDYSVPFVNRQGLWNQPEYLNAFNPSSSHLDASQGNYSGEHDWNVEYAPEQRHQHQQHDRHNRHEQHE